MANDDVSREDDLDSYRYGESDTRPFFLNWRHYLEAHKAILRFSEQHSADTPRDNSPRESVESVPSALPQIPEENRLLPIDGYFSFYSDLLGFSREVSMGGMDSLPDYYGAAFVAADKAPRVKVYLLSDSCVAFAPVSEAHEFVEFVSGTVVNWLADGLIPQCAIGYGSFVERRPFANRQPPNFFGTQITGTALPNAVNFLKDNKPSGSRTLLTPAALSHWPMEHEGHIVQDGRGGHEFIPERPRQHCLFDCLYYLLCLREHELDSSAFNHYVWSFASRAVGGGVGIPKLAVELAILYYRDCKEIDFETVISRIKGVLALYESAKS